MGSITEGIYVNSVDYKKYMGLWKSRDGGWLFVLDAFSHNIYETKSFETIKLTYTGTVLKMPAEYSEELTLGYLTPYPPKYIVTVFGNQRAKVDTFTLGKGKKLRVRIYVYHMSIRHSLLRWGP